MNLFQLYLNMAFLVFYVICKYNLCIGDDIIDELISHISFIDLSIKQPAVHPNNLHGWC